MMSLIKTRIFGVRVILVVLAAYWLTIFAGTHLPDPPDIGTSMNDKSKHFLAYFGLTVLLCISFFDTDRTNGDQDRARHKRNLLWIIGIVIAYGALDEITQSLVPGRTPDFADFVADVCGMSTGLALAFVADRYFRKSHLSGHDPA